MARPRNAVLLLLAAASLLMALPSLQAHEGEEPMNHLSVDVQDLEPGASLSRPIESPEGPLRKGWIYIIYGGVQGDHTVNARLMVDNETTATFVWEPGAFHQNSTKIQKTGHHHLELTNTGNETVRYAFYYDQSCNCVGKVIPLAGGFVLFNYDLPAETEVSLRFPTVDGWTLRGEIAWHDPALPTGDWPKDFQILKEAEQTGKGWLDLSFTTDTAGTYYVFLEAPEGASPQDPVALTPELNVHTADVTESPLPWVPVLLLVWAAAAVAAGRR